MNLLTMFVIGLLGSGHCIGMCGGFAMTIGATQPKIGPALVNQLVYSAGRVFTYGFLGALGGMIGSRFTRLELPLVEAQQVLAIVAGLLMLYIGLNSLGLFRIKWRRTADGKGEGMLTNMLRHFINAPGLGPFLLAGVFTGFLPCGLVYVALAKATTTAHPVQGWLSMVCFGVGTVPAMVLIGCGGTMLSRTLRTRVLQLAACFVILLGGVTLYRGLPLEDNCCHDPASGTVSSDEENNHSEDDFHSSPSASKP